MGYEATHKPLNSSKQQKYFMGKSSFYNMDKRNILEMLNWVEKGKCRARAKPVFPWHVCKPNIAVFRSVQAAKNTVYKLKSNWAVKVHIQTVSGQSSHFSVQQSSVTSFSREQECGWQPQRPSEMEIHSLLLQREAAGITCWFEIEGKCSLVLCLFCSFYTELLRSLLLH